MRRNEALPSNYLAKDDFPKPVLCQVATVVMESIKGERGEERKPVLYIMGPTPPVDITRGIILNGTNWDTLAEITGEEDSKDWDGKQIVVYHDPDVRYGGKKVGGIRIRAPKNQMGTPKQQEPPPIADEDVPF